MDNSTTTTSGAVETTSAHAHVWRDRLQPGTRLLADLVVTVQGTTLPTCGAGKAGLVGRVAVQGIAPAFAITTTSNAITSNYMDVPPFRTGRPPV
jgi:hypothetical protein